MKGEGVKKVADKRKGRDTVKKKSSLRGGKPLGTLLPSFHNLASRNQAAGLGQEAVHGSHGNGIS